MKDGLINAMANLEEETTLALVASMLQAGVTPFELVDLCRKGVEIVGKRYSEGVYYLSDLVMSEEIFKEVMEIIEPYFPKDATKTNDVKIIIGTIEGDIHDLGKNIVIYLLRSSGYHVYDLGVDVAPEEFIKGIKETGAAVLGICVLLTFCIGSVKAGLREKVVVVLGGYPVNDLVKEYTGADYYANDAVKALEIFSQITKTICCL